MSSHGLFSFILLLYLYLVIVSCDISEKSRVPSLDNCLLPDEAWSQSFQNFVLDFRRSFFDYISYDLLAGWYCVELFSLSF